MGYTYHLPKERDSLGCNYIEWETEVIDFMEYRKNMKILVATEKPFAKKALDGITEILQAAGYEVALLEKYTEKEQLIEAVKDVDGLIVRSDKVTAEVIEAAEQLKIVVRAGAGFDNVDLEAASARDIVVMNTPGQNSNAVAELALAMMIYMSRNRFTPGTGMELQGKTVGIHAYGNVGRLVARKAKALGMNVIAYDPFVTDNALFENDGVEQVGTIEELYAGSDFLSLHIPATDATRKSIGYKLMMSMPKGATLVNTARKEVIDEIGLEAAMTERTDLKYVTDIAPDDVATMTAMFGNPTSLDLQTHARQAPIPHAIRSSIEICASMLFSSAYSLIARSIGVGPQL